MYLVILFVVSVLVIVNVVILIRRVTVVRTVASANLALLGKVRKV